MKIFLHIGTPKTGTTSIQRFFMENRDRLADNGMFYPESIMDQNGNHTKLAAYSHDNDRTTPLKIEFDISDNYKIQAFRRKVFRELDTEFARHKPESVFMSNEHLSLMPNRSEIERLRNLLNAFSKDITVIIYLRKQMEQHVALHATRVVRGESKYSMELDSKIKEHRFYDYLGCIDTWADYFGKNNIIVRPFERKQLKDGDVVKDCLDILDVEGKFSFTKERNIRPSVECIRFLELINEHLPRFQGASLAPYHRDVGDLVKAITDGAPYREPGINEFQSLFNDQNAEIARKYLGRDDGILFMKDTEKADADAVAEELTVEKAIEISSRLWVEQCKTIDCLGTQLLAFKSLFDEIGVVQPCAVETAPPPGRETLVKKRPESLPSQQ